MASPVASCLKLAIRSPLFLSRQVALANSAAIDPVFNLLRLRDQNRIPQQLFAIYINPQHNVIINHKFKQGI